MNPPGPLVRSLAVVTTHPARRSLAQRRTDAGPLALVLAAWVLGVAPSAHPVLAHGTPFLRAAADEQWVHHGDGRTGSHPASAPLQHHHAPGSPEHLQLPLLAAEPPPALEPPMLAALALPAPPQGAVLLRRHSQEQPQAP